MHNRILFILLFFIIPVGWAQSVLGFWTTIDDKTGQPRAIVRLDEKDAKLQGTIIKVFPRQGDKGICTQCPGEFKGKPIQGLTFLWGLKEREPGIWENGQILDPKSGKIYKAKLSLKDNKLYVRGFLGFSLLGRTQVWVR